MIGDDDDKIKPLYVYPCSKDLIYKKSFISH